jgi:hypothetical protein
MRGGRPVFHPAGPRARIDFPTAASCSWVSTSLISLHLERARTSYQHKPCSLRFSMLPSVFVSCVSCLNVSGHRFFSCLESWFCLDSWPSPRSSHEGRRWAVLMLVPSACWFACAAVWVTFSGDFCSCCLWIVAGWRLVLSSATRS